MKYKRGLTTLMLVVVLLSGVMGTVSADSYHNEELSNVDPVIGNTFELSMSVFFQFAPDNLYPFVFRGENPYTWIDIDTMNCENGCLYVYNSSNGSMVKIAAEIEGFVPTQEAVYLLTATNEIVKADYSGETYEKLYTANGTVTNYVSCGSLLYFIEDNCRIVAIDMLSDQEQLLLTYEDIVQVNVFDQNKIMWYRGNDEVYYTNLDTEETIPVLTETQEQELLYSRYVEMLILTIPDFQLWRCLS